MECKRAREIIDFYIDNEISQIEKEELEEHLKTCISCNRYYKDMVRLHNLLSSEGYLEPREGFSQRVISNLPKRGGILSWLPRPVMVGLLSFAMILFLAFFRFSDFDFNKRDVVNMVKVQFMLNLKDAHAKSVSIVGDFNDWQVGKDLLSDPDKDGIWTGEITVKPGKYQYVFVIDGKKWIPDPRAKEISKDGFGGINSILDVRKKITP